MEHIGMHASDCPLSNCMTCQQLPPEPPEATVIVAEAVVLGRNPDPDQAADQVQLWLEHAAHEAGWLTTDVMRRWWALKLLEVRDYVEAQGKGRG